MSKKKIIGIGITIVAVVAVIVSALIIRNSNKVLTVEELLKDDVISQYVNIEGVVLPDELMEYEEVDLKKVTLKDTLSSIATDEKVVNFYEKQDEYVEEVIEELKSKENVKTLANTIVECEANERILSINVKYRITYVNSKVREYVNYINIYLGNEEGTDYQKTLTNVELLEKLSLGTDYQVSEQIFDKLKSVWDYTNLKDLEYGIFCTDLHFKILRNAYVSRIASEFDELVISMNNGKLYYDYQIKDVFKLLNIEETKKATTNNFERLYIKDVNKYKVEDAITYEADRFKITDSYLVKIYDLNDKHFVAENYNVRDFLDEQAVDLETFTLDDECICINKDFIDEIKLKRVTFKGLLADTFKEFITKQEKTFREMFEALREDSSGNKRSVEGLFLHGEEFGPYDTRIIAELNNDVLSLFTKNIIPTQVGDKEVLNNLFIYVKDGSKLTNTQMFEKLGYDKENVITQIATLLVDRYPDLTIENAKEKVTNNLDKMLFKIENEKVSLAYTWDDVAVWFDMEVNKGSELTYHMYEIK